MHQIIPCCFQLVFQQIAFYQKKVIFQYFATHTFTVINEGNRFH